MKTAALTLFNPKHLVIGLAMLLAAALAVALTPKVKVADQGPKIDLEAMIPKQFGDWRVDESIVPLQVSPDVQAKLDEIYSQTYSKTFINSQGYRIMVSIAYGSNQSDTLSVHKPEVCYPAQGLTIVSQLDGQLISDHGAIQVRRLIAELGPRVEPITYWIRVGDTATTGSLQQKFAKLAYTLTGKVPDGLLFRVSSIDPEADRAYRIQDAFVRDLIDHLDTEVLGFLLGKQAQG